jgi:O-glycosyl hydrolase
MNTWAFNRPVTTDAVTTPPALRLDLNNTANNDGANTQTGFLPFIIEDSGSEVNGITIDLGGDITSARRDDPSGGWTKYDISGSIPGDPCYYSPRAGERIYRDFAYGVNPSGATITLWDVGTNRDCNITIWAFDNQSADGNNRVAKWYANGTYIFDTNFLGGSTNWPRYDNQSTYSYLDLYKYAFKGRATSDYLGRIVLTSTRGPSSPADEPFAFVNAIQVEPNALIPFTPTKYAHRPMPFDGAEDTPANAVFNWKKGGLAETHDVYFGTNETQVTNANRGTPLGVLVSQDQEPNTYDPYGAAGFLKLNTTYYWRIDEVDAAPDYTIFKGETWDFTTLPYFAVEDFDSYENHAALRNVWQNNGTGAEVSVKTTIARSGNSMRYLYNNNLPPYYSEACADTADLGMNDPNWLGFGANTLTLYFYGKPSNTMGEQLYVKLTDGDSPPHTATVTYSNMNDVRLKQWNKWSISLTEFTGVNFANVARITIGFGDGSPGDAGTVYFEDITLDSMEPERYQTADGAVYADTVYQELEGFGAAAGWHEYEILGNFSQTERDRIYDAVFDDLGLDIYRVRNSYGYDSGYLNRSAQIIAGGKARNPSLKVMISSWSPPASFKSNGILENGGTLRKDANDPNNSAPNYYIYKRFAEWWADSLEEWGNEGVVADYINIQNETDYVASWASCRFEPSETDSNAGYAQAFEKVYDELYSQMGSNMPKMLASETAGLNRLNQYINNLNVLGQGSRIYGYAHHLYNGGGSYNRPDGYITLMQYYRDNYNDKPLMMTEFSKGNVGDVTTFPEAINLAQLMHNTLVFENAAAYIYWELFWTPPKGLVSYVGDPVRGTTFAPNPIYYAFKQYAKFTDPGWHRVGTWTDWGEQGDLRISAYKSPDGQQLSIVMINLSYDNMGLTLNLNGFPLTNSGIYRTSETENTAYIGPFYEDGVLVLPGRSITTISNASFSNCDSVLATGHGLTSDISGDCYVNYEDLEIITDNWLADCTGPDNCEDADFAPTDGNVNFFDLARFAEQWLLCNNPADTACMENW